MISPQISKITSMLDWIVLIVSISFQLSIVPAFLFDNFPFNSVYALTLFLTFFYIIRFGLKFPLFKHINNFLFQSFFAIYLLDIFSLLIVRGSGGQVCFRMINMFLFLNYVFSIYYEEVRRKNTNCLKFVIQPYFYYSVYNAVIVTILFILFFYGLDYQQNPLPYTLSVIEDNALNGIQYFFPYYLSVASDYHPMFGYPVFTGLFHEPHVIMFFTLPAMFMSPIIINNTKVRCLVILCFIGLMANTISTTAIICSVIVCIIEVFWSALVVHKYKPFIISLILMTLILMTVVDYFDEVITLMTFKIEGGDSSQGTSSTMLRYLFSFDQFIGEGNNPLKYGEDLKGQSAGVIISILDLTLFLYVIIKIVKQVLSKDKQIHYVAMGCLYFFLHCLKVNYLSFQYPYLAYILFIVFILDRYNVLCTKKMV